MQIKQLSHVCLYMDDLQEAEKIFVDILKRPYAHEFVNGDNKKYGFFIDIGRGTFVEIIKTDLYSTRFSFHICFEVSDIYDAHKELSKTDYDITPVRRGKTDKTLQFFWYPKSLSIEFHQFDEESIFKQKGLV